MKIEKSVEKLSYSELKGLLIEFYNLICEEKTNIDFNKLNEIHKQTIAIRAFDLVSIAMSLIGYTQLKKEPDRYYKALCTLNDAKYLATSCGSDLAIKINLHILAIIEFIEKNYNIFQLLFLD